MADGLFALFGGAQLKREARIQAYVACGVVAITMRALRELVKVTASRHG